MSFFTFEWLERRRRRRGIMGIGEFLLEAKCLSNSRAWTHRRFSLCVIIRFMSENVWASFSLSLSLLSAITMRNGDSMANISIHITVFSPLWKRWGGSSVETFKLQRHTTSCIDYQKENLKMDLFAFKFCLGRILTLWLNGWLTRKERRACLLSIFQRWYERRHDVMHSTTLTNRTINKIIRV